MHVRRWERREEGREWRGGVAESGEKEENPERKRGRPSERE